MAGEPIHHAPKSSGDERYADGKTGCREAIPTESPDARRPVCGRASLRGRLPLAAAVVLVSGCLASAALAVENTRTVIGPGNQALYDGARALIEGDGEVGVRLTLEGLARVTSDRERIKAWANLCAGYLLLDQLDTALQYCDRVIELSDRHWRSYSNRALIHVRLGRYAEAERDLGFAEAIAPNASTVKRVRALLLDAVEPVTPRIEIDDRRQPPQGSAGD